MLFRSRNYNLQNCGVLSLDVVYYKTQVMSKATGFDTHDDGPGFVGIRFCQEWFVILYYFVR